MYLLSLKSETCVCALYAVYTTAERTPNPTRPDLSWAIIYIDRINFLLCKTPWPPPPDRTFSAIIFTYTGWFLNHSYPFFWPHDWSNLVFFFNVQVFSNFFFQIEKPFFHCSISWRSFFCEFRYIKIKIRTTYLVWNT